MRARNLLPAIVVMLLAGYGALAGSSCSHADGHSSLPGLQFVIALVSFALTLSPWLVRNYAVHGELVFVKSTFGYAFWQGNHEQSFGTDKIPLARAAQRLAKRVDGVGGLERNLWDARRHDTMYIDDAVLSSDRKQQLGRFTEPERSRQLLAESIAYLRLHPEH